MGVAQDCRVVPAWKASLHKLVKRLSDVQKVVVGQGEVHQDLARKDALKQSRMGFLWRTVFHERQGRGMRTKGPDVRT
jgi:hypothetical protein